MWIARRTHEQAAARGSARERGVDHHGRRPDNTLIIHVRHYADDPIRLGTHVVGGQAAGKPQILIESVAVWKQHPSDALTDDHDALRSATIMIREFAAGDHGDPERSEEARTDVPAPRVGVVFAGGWRVAIDAELVTG